MLKLKTPEIAEYSRCSFEEVVVVWLFDLQLPVQSVPISSKVVSFYPTYSEVYSIRYYVIKFVSDLRQVGGFLRVLSFPSLIKLTATI